MFNTNKKYTKNLILLALSMTFICTAPSAQNLFPRGCEVSGFGFQGDYITFNDSGNQMFYLIQNHSQTPIELERIPVENAFLSPKLQTKLAPEQWAGLASDISNTHFKCFTRIEESIVPLNCSEVLHACQYPRVKFALSNMGSYWVSTNKSQQQVLQDTTRKGIYLKW